MKDKGCKKGTRMKRKTIAMCFGVVVLAGCGGDQSPAPQAEPELKPEPIGVEVAVAGGLVHGLVGDDGLKQYHGIPFAAPPVGALRWGPPQPAPAWTETRDATVAGPSCMQPQGQGGEFYGQSGFAMDEDCLTLNVWTRADAVGADLPVMVWIHGGALVTGSGSSYPGELLTTKGVVLVTINYRLGKFGFLAHPALSAESAKGVSGNQGLRDQIAALEWVRDNIDRFGGDAGTVTIFGESAGSLSMSLLQASPLGAGLFHRVIGESGGAFQPMWFRDKATAYAASAESAGEAFATALAGPDKDTGFDALRALPQDKVLEVFQSNPAFSNYDGHAIVDGEVIPDEVAAIFAEGRQADVPVLIGSNADEGTTFIALFTPMFGEGVAGFKAYAVATLPEVADSIAEHYPAASDAEAERAWADLFTDVLFAYPMRTWARSMENVKSNAYLYLFTWAPPIENSEKYGAFHAAEIGYVFGNVDLFGAKPTPRDYELSDQMATMWTQFAKTGSPNGEGLPDWPAYTRDNEAYMELGVSTGSKAELRIGEMDLVRRAWDARRKAK
jgi:para-nitrobenzyl esterase